MATTIKDISKKTGLGLATVSAYINGVKVKPKNQEAIEQAIKELGYVRNEYARGLKMHRSMTIGVLIPELSSVFSTSIISEMEDELRKHGYCVIVCDCKTDAELERKSIDYLMSKMVDGLIVMPVTTNGDIFKKPQEQDLPIVVIDRMTDNTSVSHIVINNREIACKATQCLMRKGNKRVALINGPSSVYTATERLKGYMEAVSGGGEYDPDIVLDGCFTVEGGYRAMKELLLKNPPVHAVMATNYDMTIGAIIAINEEGKHIPEDLNFIGFDNHEVSKVLTPRLMTVSQPIKDIGKIAAKKILGLINKKATNENIVLEAEILFDN